MINIGWTYSQNESWSIFKILTGKPVGNIFKRRRRHEWDGNIDIGIKQICANVRNWIDSANTFFP